MFSLDDNTNTERERWGTEIIVFYGLKCIQMLCNMCTTCCAPYICPSIDFPLGNHNFSLSPPYPFPSWQMWYECWRWPMGNACSQMRINVLKSIVRNWIWITFETKYVLFIVVAIVIHMQYLSLPLPVLCSYVLSIVLLLLSRVKIIECGKIVQLRTKSLKLYFSISYAPSTWSRYVCVLLLCL